eukprot:m.494584 g.494584  ORF g.494584 m.494584 type:complete len:437 (-) comp41286_c0_seq1:100-1410(-)
MLNNDSASGCRSGLAGGSSASVLGGTALGSVVGPAVMGFRDRDGDPNAMVHQHHPHAMGAVVDIAAADKANLPQSATGGPTPDYKGGAALSSVPSNTVSGGAAMPTGAVGIKVLVMMLLCAQSAAYALLRRYSQGVLQEKASPSSMLLVGELIKLAIALVAVHKGNTHYNEGSLTQKLVHLARSSTPMLVPASIYLAMNLLSYVALKRIDAGLFVVCAQTKVLATALASVFVLGRTLRGEQWRALLLLVLGAVLISEQTRPVGAGTDGQQLTSFFVGLGAVLAEVSLSGFVSVYFEKVLKTKEGTVWDRNVQLALLSASLYLPLALYSAPPGQSVLFGWSSVTWTVAWLGAMGGILVAMTLKHLDSIVKCFATSGAIVIATLMGHFLLDASFNLAIAIGASCVILSMFNYNSSHFKDLSLPGCAQLGRWLTANQQS